VPNVEEPSIDEMLGKMADVRKRVGDEVFFLAVDYAWYHFQDYPVDNYEQRSVGFAEFAIRSHDWKRSKP